MFRGITAITLDGKGRLAIPTKHRDALTSSEASSLVVTIDTESTCLLLYPIHYWRLIEEKLQHLPSFDLQARRIQRLLLGHATDVEPDGNGRILLPPLLRDHARLDKHVVMVGQGNKFELWNETIWQESCAQWLAEEASQQTLLPDEIKLLSL